MGHEKRPFYLLFRALLASFGPASVSSSDSSACSSSTSSYFRFDMDDVYASCGGVLSSKDDCNPTAYPEVVRSPLA